MTWNDRERHGITWNDMTYFDSKVKTKWYRNKKILGAGKELKE